MSFLYPLLGAVAYGAEVTQLGAIGYGAAEVRDTLTQTDVVRRRGTELGAIDLGAELSCVHEICLAQLVEPCGCGFEPHGGCFFNTFCLCH
jgi:hypothetical protein